MERKRRRNVSSPGRCGAVAKFVRICPKHPIVDGQTIRITLVDGFMVATYWVEQFVTNEDQRKAFFVVYALRWESTSIAGLLPSRPKDSQVPPPVQGCSSSPSLGKDQDTYSVFFYVSFLTCSAEYTSINHIFSIKHHTCASAGEDTEVPQTYRPAAIRCYSGQVGVGA